MSERPALPDRRNPMLVEDRTPPHEILVERRCLGQTELKVKPGQVGTSNATKLENLGVLDYAHLRVPLPKDLTGSGIFIKGSNRKWPEAYFLMRRSSDGFISATGMFKAAFPFAQAEEETAEKDYIKSLEEASSEEVAGNVWIDPGKALDLADEYGISLWIAALLDPEPIMHGTNDPKKSIRSPPPFVSPNTTNGASRTPEKSAEETMPPKRGTRGRAGGRGRTVSATPVPEVNDTDKPVATPGRKIKAARGTPGRKTRQASQALENVQEQDAKVNGEKEETVKVDIEKLVQPDANGDLVETIKTKVALPSGRKEGPLIGDELTHEARLAIEEAEKIAAKSSLRKSKRKAEEMLDVDEVVEEIRPVKRQKPVEVELRKERIRRRAWVGIAASLAVGALIPSVLNLL